MNDVQEINVDEMMAQIRENILNQQSTPTIGATTPSSNSPVAADLISLQSSREIRYFHFTSHRKFLGPLVLFAKKLARKLLTPSLERQSEYNTANIRLTSHLWEQVEALQKISRELVERIREERQQLTERVGGVYQELTGRVSGVHQELTERVSEVYQELTRQVRGVRQELTEQIERRHQELAEQIGGVHQEQAAGLQALHGELAERIGGVHQEQAGALQALRAQVMEQIAGVQREQAGALQEIRERASRAERNVRRFMHALRDSQRIEGQAEEKAPAIPTEVPHRNGTYQFDYFGFEDRFRGSETDIKGRQRIYVEFFKGLDQVLDIGCGRGEFLELLREAGINAIGVDLDLDMVLYCQEKGLEVIRQDAYTYLECLPDESLGGVFAAQVVEHLEPTRIIELVTLCQRKLQSGGVLIFETPNPMCLTVFARSFYMDFSHIRPIHPEAMKFLFESTGFQNVQAKFSGPVEACMRIPPLSAVAADAKAVDEFNRGIEQLNELLYGFQDYAVIGRKSSH
jgi:2-polyprenyl-3-methyl-5-hydroxy-6-metoxy-1,4-benzoquinol methylase